MLAAALLTAPAPASADDGPVYLAAGLRGVERLDTPLDIVNTTGGTPPAGPCEPGTEVRAPYGADYVFLS